MEVAFPVVEVLVFLGLMRGVAKRQPSVGCSVVVVSKTRIRGAH